MRRRRAGIPILGWFASLLILLAWSGGPVLAQDGPKAEPPVLRNPGQPEKPEPFSVDQLVEPVVRIKTFINPDGRTVGNLGKERDGSGIVIDANGLVLTIGYLMVEAHSAQVVTNDGRTIPANIVGYDNETGFGLLQAISPLKLRPMPIGKSADLKVGDPVLASSFGGRDGTVPAYVASRREFAGSWEYLVDSAIYTMPAHSHWSGAALINREGKLVGVGSLIVGDAAGKGDGVAGNMYVPIDLLPPILADLIADGRPAAAPKPWLGVSAEASKTGEGLTVSRVTPQSPAEEAGIKRGDRIVAVNGAVPDSLADFYRKMWALGGAGAVVPLDIERDGSKQHFDVKSMNRLDHLKLKSTF
jgi:S1-C subfamily serine protease